MTVVGAETELARYELPGGEVRRVVGQRIDGRVAIIDIPEGDEGRVHLVERHVESVEEMAGLVAAYVADSVERGEPAVLVPRELGGHARD